MARRKFVRNSCAILTGSALHRYAMFATYAKSKLAQVATTFELQRREAAARSGVRAVALHPGNSYTDVIRDYPLPVRIANAAIAPIWAMVTQSAADSALTSLYAVATPDPDATIEFSGLMASAMSAFSAFSMPYRIDGTPMILPTGLQMVESESWRATPVRHALQADDCDGSACSAVSVVTRAAAVAANPALAAQFPYLTALGNSLGAHYVFGTCVLAANAGQYETDQDLVARLNVLRLASNALGMRSEWTAGAVRPHRMDRPRSPRGADG